MVSERRCSLCFPIRYLVLALVMTMVGIAYLTRVNINVSILAMVKNSGKSHDNSTYGCPLDDSDDSSNDDNRYMLSCLCFNNELIK